MLALLLAAPLHAQQAPATETAQVTVNGRKPAAEDPRNIVTARSRVLSRKFASSCGFMSSYSAPAVQCDGKDAIQARFKRGGRVLRMAGVELGVCQAHLVLRGGGEFKRELGKYTAKKYTMLPSIGNENKISSQYICWRVRTACTANSNAIRM